MFKSTDKSFVSHIKKAGNSLPVHKILRSKILVFLLVGLLAASGCTSPATKEATGIPVNLPQATPSSTPLPAPSSIPAPTLTPIPPILAVPTVDTTRFATMLYIVQKPYIGIWISKEELASLPTDGPAWEALKAAADKDPGKPEISNQDQNNDVYVLAKALVFARTGEQKYREEVIDNLMKAIDTEKGGRTLALGRNMPGYVIAADLVNLPADSKDDATFRDWLKRILTENLDGRSLRSTHEDRPNNWGTHAGAARAAISLYLGDKAELERTAAVFHGYVGDISAYHNFKYDKDLSWQCDPLHPVSINPVGCMKDGHSIDGALPEEMRRGDSFLWPPATTGYAWEALQGAYVQAEILYRAGYPTWDWQDKALLRAVNFLYSIDWKPQGDDEWLVWLINNAYGTNFPAALPAKPGKNMGWTDWTSSNQ